MKNAPRYILVDLFYPISVCNETDSGDSVHLRLIFGCFKRMNTHLNRAGELNIDVVLISHCEPISGHRLDLVSYTALLTSHYGVYHLFIDLHDV